MSARRAAAIERRLNASKGLSTNLEVGVTVTADSEHEPDFGVQGAFPLVVLPGETADDHAATTTAGDVTEAEQVITVEPGLALDSKFRNQAADLPA